MYDKIRKEVCGSEQRCRVFAPLSVTLAVPTTCAAWRPRLALIPAMSQNSCRS